MNINDISYNGPINEAETARKLLEKLGDLEELGLEYYSIERTSGSDLKIKVRKGPNFKRFTFPEDSTEQIYHESESGNVGLTFKYEGNSYLVMIEK